MRTAPTGIDLTKIRNDDSASPPTCAATIPRAIAKQQLSTACERLIGCLCQMLA
jgi:hypothetical protein